MRIYSNYFLIFNYKSLIIIKVRALKLNIRMGGKGVYKFVNVAVLTSFVYVLSADIKYIHVHIK